MANKNQNTRKTHCRRGHLLADPNLVAGEKKRNVRKCVACNRATAYVSRHPEARRDLQAVADRYYLQIMGEDALVEGAA